MSKRLAEMRVRHAAATAGIWEIPDGDLNGRIWAIGPIEGYDGNALDLEMRRPRDAANALFVRHAHQDMAALLALAEAAVRWQAVAFGVWKGPETRAEMEHAEDDLADAIEAFMQEEDDEQTIG